MNDQESLPDAGQKQRFAVFRFADASPEDGLPNMVARPMPPAVVEHGQKLMDAGALTGTEGRMLFSGAGYTLAYAWFKSGFPLPRHTHDSDCLYFIVGGSLRLGNEELKAGDGFFIGKDVPYLYTPGPNGVEVLEFRSVETFDINTLAGSSGFWDKALQTVLAKRDSWKSEPRPSGYRA
jgi:hypothetical protein